MSALSVVIPVRKGGSPGITLSSLAGQTFRDFEAIVSWDQKANANWARNRGAELAESPLILFSDDDIKWEPDALAVLIHALEGAPAASFAYGGYENGERIQCDQPFCRERLLRANYISTMSLVQREHFPGFDETVERLQDWDLWLTMIDQGRVGVYCGSLIFRTDKGNGITYGGSGPTWAEACAIVKGKHGLA